MKRYRMLVLMNPGELDSQPEPALARAVFLAREMNATLDLFVSDHASFLPPPLGGKGNSAGASSGADFRATQARMQAIAESLVRQEQLTVAADVLWCRHPVEAIMHRVCETRPDIVVKTTRHDSALKRTLFKYSDWHLIRTCPSPLMLVKGQDHWETRRIIACVDPAHVHSHAETLDDVIIENAQMLAYRLRGELHIFHSIEILTEAAFRVLHPDSSYADYGRTAAEEHQNLVEDLIRRFGIGCQRVHYAVGNPADTLPEFARALQASLVVMGAVSKGTLELLFIGNTAERVLDDLSCDVLVVKSTPIEVRAPETECIVC